MTLKLWYTRYLDRAPVIQQNILQLVLNSPTNRCALHYVYISVRCCHLASSTIRCITNGSYVAYSGVASRLQFCWFVLSPKPRSRLFIYTEVVRFWFRFIAYRIRSRCNWRLIAAVCAQLDSSILFSDFLMIILWSCSADNAQESGRRRVVKRPSDYGCECDYKLQMLICKNVSYKL